MRPIQHMPSPCLTRSHVAGERIRAGALLTFRRDPENRRRWLLFNHDQPGGEHAAIIAIESKSGVEYTEPGEQCYYTQYFGPMSAKAILRAGERVWQGTYRDGGTGGTPLVSGSGGTLISASRFINAARYVGYACEDVDLTNSSEDQVITIRTEYYSGKVAVAG